MMAAPMSKDPADEQADSTLTAQKSSPVSSFLVPSANTMLALTSMFELSASFLANRFETALMAYLSIRSKDSSS